MKDCIGLEQPYTTPKHWYTAVYDDFVQSEGLEHLSYEKRETSHISSGRYSIALFIIQNATGTVLRKFNIELQFSGRWE